MRPVSLHTERLLLDQPTLDDVDLVTEYCQDPLFESFMLTPWPYSRDDAEKFVGTVIPILWEDDTEYTWALRSDGRFLGLVCFRPKPADVGFWLGAPHRGNGFMPEAVDAVVDWAFGRGASRVNWECVPGNAASASVARSGGFSWRGEAPSRYPARDGGAATAWHASLAVTDSRETKPWPAFTRSSAS